MTTGVTICECFARDGLQHEESFVPTDMKVELIDLFARCGFNRVEAVSYSHPKHVPAFADASDVLARISRRDGVFYKATCPNLRAVERANADVQSGYGANELSFLVSATESHTARNLRTDRTTQWNNVKAMVEAVDLRFRLVGVISMAFGCAFEGVVDEGGVVEDVRRFAELGVALVCLGDTAGFATPKSVKQLVARVKREVPDIVPVAHFHDSRGAGLANCVAALEAGCTHFDSSFGGVGGHPNRIQYGEGYTGNVATEDLVNLFEDLGIETGLDLDMVIKTSRRCEEVLARPLNSMVARSGYGLNARRTLHG
jgi:hydroxymethylglutaryl-CoA lyase